MPNETNTVGATMELGRLRIENESLRQQNAELVRALEAMLHGLRVPTSKEDHNAEREEACAMARAILATVQS